MAEDRSQSPKQEKPDSKINREGFDPNQEKLKDLTGGFEVAPKPEYNEVPVSPEAVETKKEREVEYDPSGKIIEKEKIKVSTSSKSKKKSDLDEKLSRLTATQDEEIKDYVKKTILNGEISTIKQVKKKYRRDPRKMDEFHDALMEYKQLD